MRITALEDDVALLELDDFDSWRSISAVFSALSLLWDTEWYLKAVGTTHEDWRKSSEFYFHLAKSLRVAGGRKGRRVGKWRACDSAPVPHADAPLAGEVVCIDAFKAVLRFSRWQLECFSRVACMVTTRLADPDFETIMDCKKSHVIAIALEFQRALDLLRKPC